MKDDKHKIVGLWKEDYYLVFASYSESYSILVV